MYPFSSDSLFLSLLYCGWKREKKKFIRHSQWHQKINSFFLSAFIVKFMPSSIYIFYIRCTFEFQNREKSFQKTHFTLMRGRHRMHNEKFPIEFEQIFDGGKQKTMNVPFIFQFKAAFLSPLISLFLCIFHSIYPL